MKKPGVKKAKPPKTIELPLDYVLALEACGDELARFVDEPLSAEGINDARRALKREGELEGLLTRAQKDALGLWD